MKKLLCMLLCLILLTGAASVLAEESEGVSAEAMVQELLETQAARQKDAWILAVLESGAQDIRLEDNQLSFTLCGFDPNLSALGKYAAAEDKAA